MEAGRLTGRHVRRYGDVKTEASCYAERQAIRQRCRWGGNDAGGKQRRQTALQGRQAG